MTTASQDAVEMPEFKFGKQFLFGLATFLAVLGIKPADPGGDTQSPRYFYSVWLRHLVMAHEAGLNKIRQPLPNWDQETRSE